jgi:hypothetical protein
MPQFVRTNVHVPTKARGGGGRGSGRWLRRVSVAALPMLLLAGLTPLSAQAALSSVVGPVDGSTHFPAWYADTNGLAVQPCLDGLVLCPTAAGDIVDAEAFYSLVTADVGVLNVRLAIEAAHLAPGNGQEITFARSQYTATHVGDLAAGADYTITDPYGSQVCTADSNGILPNRGNGGCRVQTGGGVELDFASTTTGRIGPFLTWDTFPGGPGVGAPPPAGYIGDNATPHAVTGSASGFNMARVEGPGINKNPSVDGCPTLVAVHANADCLETDQFIVSGKVQPNGPAASANVSALDFGNVAGTQPTKSISYGSTGSAPAIVSNVTLGGPDAADFEVTSGCGAAAGIPSGSTCPITVAFTPRAGVASSATLTITDNTPGSGRVISLRGSSVPVTTLDRTSMAFANQKVGTTSPTDTVIVENTGVSPLTATATLSGTGAGHFKVASNLCSTPVAPLGGCEIAVSFAPTTSGAKTANLVVTNNAGQSSSVALSGRGTTSTISVSPTSLVFPDTATGSATSSGVTVTNGGTASAIINSITTTAEFTNAASSTCAPGTNLAPGASCLANVTFRPGATGARSGTLTVTADGVASTVSLNGNGVAPAATVPGAPTLGTVTKGNLSAVVRWTAPANTGGSAITSYSVLVTKAVGGAPVGAPRTAGATAKSLTVSGLVNGTAVKFQVQARNALGLGAKSALSAAVTPSISAPSAPVIGAASPGAIGGVINATARWTPPTNNGGSAVNGYIVVAQRMSSTGVILSSTSSPVQASTLRALTMTLPAANYKFVVVARNAVGRSGNSAVSNLVTAR